MKNDQAGERQHRMTKINGPALAKLGELAGEVTSARQAAGDSVTEVTAGWVAPHLLLTLRTELAERAEGAARLKLLRQAAGDVATLQRGNAWAARLQMDRERLEFQRQKHKDMLEIAKETAAKLAGAHGKKRDLNEPMTEEELKACVDKVDEIMGIKLYAQRVREKEMEGLAHGRHGEKAPSVQHPSSREAPSTNIQCNSNHA